MKVYGSLTPPRSLRTQRNVVAEDVEQTWWRCYQNVDADNDRG